MQPATLRHPARCAHLANLAHPALATTIKAAPGEGGALAQRLHWTLLPKAASLTERCLRLLTRWLGSAALGLAVALSTSIARGADFPSRPIRVVVDNPPGAINDIYARMIAKHLSDTLGQPVVIDNRPGASGVVAAEEVLRSAPDGYTLLFGGMSPLVTTPAAGGRLRFDPKSGFIPTAFATGGYPLIAVSSQHEARSLEGLQALARRAAAPLTCATIGNGSTSHFACAVLARALGIQVTMVPYKGTTFAMQDAAAGHIDMVPAFPSEVAPLVEAGKLKALAVLGPARIPRVAAVPTTAELGFADAQLGTFAGLYYPAGTPREIVEVVNRAAVKAMQQEDIVERLKIGGGTTRPLDAKEFADFVATQQTLWKQIADSAGIKAESN